jgi:hypothetical protein
VNEIKEWIYQLAVSKWPADNGKDQRHPAIKAFWLYMALGESQDHWCWVKFWRLL